jgi:hypothetical protein
VWFAIPELNSNTLTVQIRIVLETAPYVAARSISAAQRIDASFCEPAQPSAIMRDNPSGRSSMAERQPSKRTSQHPSTAQHGNYDPAASAPSSSPSSEVSDPAGPDSELILNHPDLVRLCKAWPTLPEPVRDRILGMVDAAQAMRGDAPSPTKDRSKPASMDQRQPPAGGWA